MVPSKAIQQLSVCITDEFGNGINENGYVVTEVDNAASDNEGDTHEAQAEEENTYRDDDFQGNW